MARSSQFPPSVNPGIPKEQKPPIGWKLVQFGEILRVEERPAKLIDEVEYQLVTAKRNRGGIIHRENLIGKKILTKNQYYLRSGDFLISRRQIVHGACGIVPEWLDGAIASNEYATLLPNNDILLEYLSYYSHTTHFQQTCFHSSIGVDVEKMVFKINDWFKHRMLLPPISEQQKICTILSSVDDAIQATQAVIDQTRRVKQGLLQQLLTRGIGHTRFKQTEIGEIPEVWDWLILSEVAELVGGTTPSKIVTDYWWGEIPWATPSDITSLPPGTNYIFETSSKITKLALENTSLQILNPGSVLMTSRATIGEVAINMVPMTTNQGFCNFKPNSSISAEYLANWLKFSNKKLLKLAAGSTFLEISKKTLKNIKIGLPPLSEQKKIYTILTDVDDVLNVEYKKLLQIQKTKRGLIQDLLTGCVRVKLDDEAAI